MSFYSDLNSTLDLTVTAFNIWNIVSDWRNFKLKDTPLKHIKNNNLTIIDLSTDPYNVSAIKDKFKSIDLDKKVIYLVADINQVIDETTIFFPSLMFFRSVEYQKCAINLDKRAFKVSCLNRIPRAHKFYTYLKLLELSYTDMLLSFNGVRDSNTNSDIDPNDFNYFGDLYTRFPNVPLYKESMVGDTTWNNDLGIAHPAFSNTYLNVVTETNHLYSFYSEKICKPLASGQLFLVSGGQNSLSGLRYLGFDCFDDLFCGHSYDKDSDYICRIDGMITQLDGVYTDIESLYHANINRVADNRNYFVSVEFRERLMAPLHSMGLMKRYEAI